jgi:hypothetical protein
MVKHTIVKRTEYSESYADWTSKTRAGLVERGLDSISKTLLLPTGIYWKVQSHKRQKGKCPGNDVVSNAFIRTLVESL